jgi:hypothetical protein
MVSGFWFTSDGAMHLGKVRRTRSNHLARIERVVIHHRSIPLKRPFVTAVRTAHAVDALLVEVRDRRAAPGGARRQRVGE